MNLTPFLHGGARPGAGAYREPTQPLRVPESQLPSVVAFLDAYRDGRTLEDEGVRAAVPRGVKPSRRRAAVPF